MLNLNVVALNAKNCFGGLFEVSGTVLGGKKGGRVNKLAMCETTQSLDQVFFNNADALKTSVTA